MSAVITNGLEECHKYSHPSKCKCSLSQQDFLFPLLMSRQNGNWLRGGLQAGDRQHLVRHSYSGHTSTSVAISGT